jgi:gamma-glutamyltranspeptidase/glutathione hydrolase
MSEKKMTHSYCPTVRGRKVMIASGNVHATWAGAKILERGGNATDAGVAAGICLAVTQPDLVSFAGVAPIMIYTEQEREVVTIDGLGVWPQRANLEYFKKNTGGIIPPGVLRAVVPGAPDAWISALARYGTMTFAEVTEDAIRLAADGFPVHRVLAKHIAADQDVLRKWPGSADLFLPSGKPLSEGEMFFQSDLARVIQQMVDAEANVSSGDRLEGLEAARNVFYRGAIARRISEFMAEEGGFLTFDDMANYRVRWEPPVNATYKDYQVYACGPWSQGPVLLQTLQILNETDLSALEHNSAEYIHLVIEALKLALGDREAHYGDPRFVNVPIEELLSRAYSARRHAEIDPMRAFQGLPDSGLPTSNRATATAPTNTLATTYDTSYVCVVDGDGNAFSATPSDLSKEAPIVPGLGCVVSPRGSQSWIDENHASSLMPGKRPRLTPNPAMAFRDGQLYMPFGTPGGDVQCQAMCQTFLNLVDFHMGPQMAVEAPRFATHTAPNSFSPHSIRQNVVTLESDIPERVARELKRMGHEIGRWERLDWEAGGVCLITVDAKSGVRTAGADPRRECYALGW